MTDQKRPKEGHVSAHCVVFALITVVNISVVGRTSGKLQPYKVALK